MLYGRSTSALGDTPLITYGQQSPDPDGSDTDLSYTVIWTHEDVGDGVVAAYEWGLWGRMTDIETVLNEKVYPNGKILSASYLSCGCEGVPYIPTSFLRIRPKAAKPTSPIPGPEHRLGWATTSGSGAGETREAAMDTNSWTYRISNDEVGRETATSSDPHNFLAGSYPQYLIVDIDSHPVGTASVSISVQLDDGSWYSNDYQQMTAPGPATTFPFYNGGHGRTVIKLATGWHASAIHPANFQALLTFSGVG